MYKYLLFIVMISPFIVIMLALLISIGDGGTLRVKLFYSCINGHLYYSSRDRLAPIFDYRFDQPLLVRCWKSENGLEYEREKVNE